MDAFIEGFLSEPLFVARELGHLARARLFAAAQFLASDPRGHRILAGAVPGDQNDDDFWPDDSDDDGWISYLRPYNVSGGTLMIPVQGVLLAQFPYALGGYATGYQYIERAFSRGMSDPTVQRIALVIDSPGGMVSECFDTVDEMSAASGKPVRSFASDSAYSAAYAIATVGDQIVVSRTGGVGSIGVVTAHVDYSGALDQAGIKITFVSAPEGGFKTEGNPYEPLSDEARARMQERIDALYNVFVSTVATNRGMTAEAVRATQALCFSAPQAIENGLADTVGRLDKSLAAFAAEGIPTTLIGATRMADVKEEDHRAAVAAATSAGSALGATAERARISAIMGCAEAAKRPIAAREIAFGTSMPEAEAKAFLLKLPEEKVVAPTEGTAARALFDAAMASNNPELHVGGTGAESKTADQSGAILKDYAAAGGLVRERKTA